jgi:hypothetical protein
MAELADARFYSNPDDVQPAVEMAEKAIERVPNSEIGRFMSAAIRNRMATYLLAAGRLDEARSLFRVLASEAQPEQIEQEIGRRFSDLAHSHLWTTNERLPQAFPRWVEFAIEFNPEFEATLPDTESARVLDLALRRGADLRVISAFIDRVLAEHPESEPYLSLRSRINDALGIPTTQPAATTQPANGDDPTGPTSAPAP